MPEVDTKIERVLIDLCSACIDGVGDECHTPGCALYLHSVDLPIHRELLVSYESALASAREQTIEECAKIADHWHYKKGGYATLAHSIRELATPSTPQPKDEA